MVMVINEPCCMSTGYPARNCGCPQHRGKVRNWKRGHPRQGLVVNIPDDLDYTALAELLGIDTSPDDDPIAFVAELRGAVGELQDKLTLQGQPAPAPDDDLAMPGDDDLMANLQGYGSMDDSDNVLPVFNVNFEEMASPRLRQDKPPKRRRVVNEADNTLPVFDQRPLTKFQKACLDREREVAQAVASQWASD